MNKTISCIIVDDETMAREIIATHLSKINNVKIVASCKNAVEAFNSISNTQIDLVFLDINMPEISGISFAKSINKDIKIIFTTAYRDYAVEGFELQAVDYLLKPISFERLLKSITTYFDVYHHSPIVSETPKIDHNFMFIRSDRKMIKIDFESISYLESYSDYIKIHCEDKTIVARETISAIEAKLPSHEFIRVHRSYIVAISKISSFTNEHIVVSKKAIPISRTYKKGILKQLGKY